VRVLVAGHRGGPEHDAVQLEPHRHRKPPARVRPVEHDVRQSDGGEAGGATAQRGVVAVLHPPWAVSAVLDRRDHAGRQRCHHRPARHHLIHVHYHGRGPHGQGLGVPGGPCVLPVVCHACTAVRQHDTVRVASWTRDGVQPRALLPHPQHHVERLRERRCGSQHGNLCADDIVRR